MKAPKDILYASHAAIVWVGSIWQIIHVFSHQSATDITLIWVIALTYGEIAALPLSCGSKYKVWALCHKIGVVLLGILLVGVILYR